MSVTKAAVKMVEIHLPQVMIAILCTFHPSHKLWGIEWVHWAYPMLPFGGACWRANYFFQLFFKVFFKIFFVYLFGLGTFDTKFVSRDHLMRIDKLYLVGKMFKKSGFSLVRQALSGKFGYPVLPSQETHILSPVEPYLLGCQEGCSKAG